MHTSTQNTKSTTKSNTQTTQQRCRKWLGGYTYAHLNTVLYYYYRYLALCLFPIANRMLTTSGTMTRTTLHKVITFGEFQDCNSKDVQIDNQIFRNTVEKLIFSSVL